MTINKLGNCKTLEDFNAFSKNVQTDMDSGGRSFIYAGPDGKERSYTMNQIVRQFDKCIKKSIDDPERDTNLCTEVNEGLAAIDQWNAEADGRENTSMLSIRKWLGNCWYSLTHAGFDKDETLTKIRDAYPKALASLPPIPQDAVNLIMKNIPGLNQADLAAFAQVSKSNQAKVMEIEAENDALIAEYGIFGRKQWQAHGIEIGNVPALPKGIREIMESDCPIWEGKKVSETHRLVLMPETVNGKPLTLNRFGRIAKKTSFPDTNTGYRYIYDPIAKGIGDTPIDKSYWVLMTKEPIPESLNKNYADQQTVLTDLSQNSSSDYEAPLALEAAVFALTQYFEDGTRLFADRYTSCQETVGSYQVCVGGFAPAGLNVNRYNSGYDDLGVAARRMF